MGIYVCMYVHKYIYSKNTYVVMDECMVSPHLFMCLYICHIDVYI